MVGRWPRMWVGLSSLHLNLALNIEQCSHESCTLRCFQELQKCENQKDPTFPAADVTTSEGKRR
jgi:hypothetical protein